MSMLSLPPTSPPSIQVTTRRRQHHGLLRIALIFGLLAGVGVITAGCGSEGGAGADATDGGTTGADGAGTDGSGFPSDRVVFLNEIVAKAVANGSNPTGSDWVELYNKSNKKIDLAGWRIIDSKSKLFAEAIPLPKGVSIPARGYVVIYFNKDGAGSPTIPKGLSATEAVSLFSADGVLQDRVDWKAGDAPEGKSWGRTPDGGAVTQTFDKPSPNGANP